MRHMSRPRGTCERPKNVGTTTTIASCRATGVTNNGNSSSEDRLVWLAWPTITYWEGSATRDPGTPNPPEVMRLEEDSWESLWWRAAIGRSEASAVSERLTRTSLHIRRVSKQSCAFQFPIEFLSCG